MATAITSGNSPRLAWAARDIDALPVLIATGLLIGLANRLAPGLALPLWFDESFSAVIASQRDFAGLLRWCLAELSGPVYYGSLWAWEKLAGESNVALRIPSLVASVAAPLLILWRGHPDRETRLLWATLTALWVPGFDHASDARPYALLFLLATAQSIAFAALIRAPATRVALAWTSLSALCVLTHYHAVVLAGLQGVAYLAIHRKRALATWPALLALIPMAAWMVFHLPLVLGFATSDSVWYATYPLQSIVRAPEIMLGSGLVAPLLVLALLATLIGHWARRSRGGPKLTCDRAELTLALTGLGAFAIVFGLAFVRPSFTPRYLIPYAPAIMFGLALWLRELGKHRAVFRDAALIVCLGGALMPLIARFGQDYRDPRPAFSFEPASRWLSAQGTRRLIFYWDNPSARTGDPANLGAAGGYFMRRSGRPVEVAALILTPGADPNLEVLAAANARSNSGVIWIKRNDTRTTAASTYGMRLAQIDPRWRCHDFGGRSHTILACARRDVAD